MSLPKPSPEIPSSVYIENLGCAKNQVDAEIMGARLQEAGWNWVDDPASAALILVNTCGFIEPAQEESINTALALLAEHPRTPVALAGCLAQRFSEELAEGMPELAGVFGNREPDRVVEFVQRLQNGPVNPVVWLPPGDENLAEPRRGRLLSHPGSTFLKVAEGCNHRCSFCAIPSIRGDQRIRSVESLVTEFRELWQRGIFEFNLVAQDLAAWNGEGGLMALLRRLLQEPGEFWLRPLYLYPDQFPLEIVDLSLADHRLLPYFDLSFQHASPEILRRMGRPGDAGRYLDLVESIRAINPDTVLRSSFIVGFPGETAGHLEELRAFLRDASLEWVGVFEFSPQAGTPAGVLKKGVVSPREKKRRRSALEELQQPIVEQRLARFVGRVVPVLLEEPIQGTTITLGRSRMQAPDVDGLVVVHDTDGCLPGTVIHAEITAVSGVDLQARVVSVTA